MGTVARRVQAPSGGESSHHVGTLAVYPGIPTTKKSRYLLATCLLLNIDCFFLAHGLLLIGWMNPIYRLDFVGVEQFDNICCTHSEVLSNSAKYFVNKNLRKFCLVLFFHLKDIYIYLWRVYTYITYTENKFRLTQYRAGESVKPYLIFHLRPPYT